MRLRPIGLVKRCRGFRCTPTKMISSSCTSGSTMHRNWRTSSRLVPGVGKLFHKWNDLSGRRICLWHVPSGSLPLLHPHPSDAVDVVADPWSGWQELRPEAHGGRHPYFGAGHVGVFWLNRHPSPSKDPTAIGFSSFEWIGNRYQPADVSTERFWKRLRSWIIKQTVKLPRSGPLDERGEVFAFPSAAAKIRSGVARDSNPSA